MHQVIAALVFAESEDDALDKAKTVFDDLCGENPEQFDYYVTFDEDGYTVAGKDRWGEIPPVMEANSEEGSQLVEQLTESTKRELFENLTRIRHGLSVLSNEDLWNGTSRSREAEGIELDLPNWVAALNSGENKQTYTDTLCLEPDMLRFFMFQAGKYAGSSVFLYDNDGEGIRNQKHLDSVLNYWQSIYSTDNNPYLSKKLYIVPADTHH